MIMMNNNLRIFLQVAEKGSFTATADQMFISQPAVSRAIKSLEEELNVRLFLRDKRNGLILTDIGKKILILTRQMADTENRIYQMALQENNLLGGKVRIASMPIFTSVILSKVFYNFQKKYPNIILELVEGSASEIRTAILEHKVDFGFTVSPFGTLDSRILLEDQMAAISTDLFGASYHANLKDTTERYIMCHAGHETILEELKNRKIYTEHIFTVQQAETVIRLVEEHNGIGIISEFVLNATPNTLNRYPVTPSVKIDIGLAAASLNDQTPAALTLIEMIQETCTQYKKEHL